MIREAVILAAGRGSRLARGQTDPDEFSKPLFNVAGRTLIQRVLDCCVTVGVQRAIVVTGYRADLVRDQARRAEGIEVVDVYNDRWEEPNGVSVLAARDQVNGPFFLMMADHLFDSSILVDLAATESTADVTLATDRRIDGIPDLVDATKVRVEGQQIVAIGKELSDFNAIDCGLFRCTRALFPALDDAAAGAPPSLTAGLKALIRLGTFHSLDIGNRWWQDVDTPRMAQAAEIILANREQ